MKIAFVAPPSRPLGAQRQHGFALLITLILVSFLVLILVGFAAFTRVELQTALNYQQLDQARQNALMALNLAVGEIQENLGPDKRTSANAELVDSTFDTATKRATRNPYWVGAWNTEGGFRGWLVSGNESTLQPANPATDVVSVPVGPLNVVSADTTKSTGYAITTTSGTPAAAVLLVGPNSVGTTGTPAQRYVFAPVRDLQVPASSIPGLGAGSTKTTIGRYAWWVGDDGVKANLAAPVAPPPAATTADRLKFLSGSPNRGVATLGTPWDAWPPASTAPATQIATFSDNQAKLLTRQQIPFVNPTITADQEKARFHEFTTVSAGVLSDSKNGGLRKDLSIAFEIPEALFKNTEFTRVLTTGEVNSSLAFATLQQGDDTHLSSTSPLYRATKTAINYQDPSWPNLDASNYDANYPWVYRGPTFDQLRDHYQLYRRLSSPFSATASVASQVFRPNVTDMTSSSPTLEAPWAGYFGQELALPQIPSDLGSNGNNFAVQDSYLKKAHVRIKPMTTELVPEVIRFTYTYSVQSYVRPPSSPPKLGLNIIYNPFIVLHNPYNVNLISQPLWIRAQRTEMGFMIRNKNLDITTENYLYSGSKDLTIKDPDAFKPGKEGQSFLNLVSISYKNGTDDNDEGAEQTKQSLDYILSDNGLITGTIDLKPGETRLYFIGGSALTPISDFIVAGPNKNRTLYLKAYNPATDDYTGTGVYLELMKPGKVPYEFDANSTLEFLTTVKMEGHATSPSFPWLPWRFPEWTRFWVKLVPPGIPNHLLPSGTPLLPSGLHNEWETMRFYQFFPNEYWVGNMAPASPSPIYLTAADIAAPLLRRFIGKSELYVKPAKDTAAGTGGRDNYFSLATHNPRAMVQSPGTAGRQGPASTRGPATWTGSAAMLNSITPEFDNRFWGTGTSSADGGQSQVVLWDIPRAPMTSIAGFQNANLSRLCTAPAYAVGNSYASPYFPADRTWRRIRAPEAPNVGGGELGFYWNLDDSYIFNEGLFDSYYFSGVNPGSTDLGWNNSLPDSAVVLGSSDPTATSYLQTALDNWQAGGATALPNAAYKFSLPTGRSTTDASNDLNLDKRYTKTQEALATSDDVRPHNAITTYLLNQGAFNVNSISVDAWRVMLAGLRGAAVDYLSSSSSLADGQSASGTPFPRTSLQGSDSGTGTDTQLWNGFRSLDDAKITALATAIVAEIKARARNRTVTISGVTTPSAERPFTTLAEFINRRLTPSMPYSQMGALQAALDTAINLPDTGINPPGKNSLSALPVIAASTNFKTANFSGGANESATLTTDYDNPQALAAATIAGAPQWLTQADLLERIGQKLSARSDTFTVRTYGESVNPITGVVQGRAWLEAVVQRETSYVDTSVHPALPLSVVATTSPTSAQFGRRFKVVSFRWLSPSDI